jgi:heme-degrading monooxygenase HmoA
MPDTLEVCARVAEFMSRQPGFISGRLYRSLEPNTKFPLVTVAESESADHFMRALAREELRNVAKGMKQFRHYPARYEVIRE